MKLGWIDFSEKDRKRALEVIQNLTERGAVDEIGIGVVRDAFSDYFFPGTSTVQTRAKYFLLSPYIIRDVCRKTRGTSVRQVLDEINRQEKEFAAEMKNVLSESSGLIGYRVLPGGWVARKPYDIYWNGLRTFGILKQNVSISYIIRYTLEQKSRVESTIKGKAMEDEKENTGDDTDAGARAKISFWNLPETKGWENNHSIGLTAEEADFLEERMKQSCKGKLLEIILSNRIDVREIGYFDLLCEKVKDIVDDNLRYMLGLAKDFSRFTYCARTLYNLFLLGEEKVHEQWSQVEAEPEKFASVDLDAVFYQLRLDNNPKLKKFLKDLQASVLAKDWESCRTVLVEQEKRIKGASRAKLLTKDKYQNWIGGGYLDYRYGATRRLLTDIYDAQDAEPEE